MRAKTKELGDPEDNGTSIGPVVDKAQYDRIIGTVDTARLEKQGTLLMGGKKGSSKVISLEPWLVSTLLISPHSTIRKA
jgi:aldehyde dehydrogenase (NAD+)